MTDNGFIEVNEENLRHYYLELNTRLSDMPDVFGIPMGTIRKRLKSFGVEKTQKQAGQNGSTTQKINGNNVSHFKKLFENDPEKFYKMKAKGVISRRANRLESLAAEGASYEEVYRVYITENNSIIKTGKHFNRDKSTMRSLLSFYNITKDPAVAEVARKKGFAELYADKDRVAEMVAKTRETSLERYGNNWYHNTASKEEMAVRELIVENFPNLEVIQGSYGVIRRPGSGGLLQLDFYFPEINLAIEYNGIYWHDKAAYLQDLTNGTEHSREALKDRLCREESIELVHIWSDEWKLDVEESFQKLSVIISERLL